MQAYSRAVTNDPVREPTEETTAPTGWTPTSPDALARQNPAWMASPPPAAATPAVGWVGIAVGVILLIVGLGLMGYGVPAVILHIRASMGDGWPPEGNFGRAAVGMVGFFLALVGAGSLLAAVRGRRS